MQARLFLITKTRKKRAQLKIFEAGAQLLNNSFYRLKPSLQTHCFNMGSGGKKRNLYTINFLCEKGDTTSSSQYHWKSKPFILWLLLTLECMANYNSPSVGDCCRLKQDMKGLWGMAVLVMGREQIEEPQGQHTSIISMVSLVQRQSKGPGLRLRGCFSPTLRNESKDSLYPVF